MLIIEKSRNGQSIVVVKRDWHPSRIGIACATKPKFQHNQEQNIPTSRKQPKEKQ